MSVSDIACGRTDEGLRQGVLPLEMEVDR